MDYKCTDFSDGEDWSAGEKSYTYTFPDSADHYYQFGYKYTLPKQKCNTCEFKKKKKKKKKTKQTKTDTLFHSSR